MKGTKTAAAVLEIQDRLPNARVLYVSATAAAETKDLGYMTRLGIWGEGCPFVNFGTRRHERVTPFRADRFTLLLHTACYTLT